MWTNTKSGYGLITISLHWIAVIGIAVMFLIGWRADELGEAGDRAGRIEAMGWHIAIGSVLALILIARIAQHYLQKQPVPPAQPRALNIISSLTHNLLLLAILILIVSGPMAIWSNGGSVKFAGMWPIPGPFAEKNEGLHELFEQAHAVGRYALYVLIPLHLLGVLKHVFIDKDGVLMRMLAPAKRDVA
jgi:cytochrome b561